MLDSYDDLENLDGLDLSALKDNEHVGPQPLPATCGWDAYREAKRIKDPEMLVAAMSEEDDVLIAGPAGAGKTFLVLDMALALATGTPILGHYQLTKSYRVLVLVEEDRREMTLRRWHKLVHGRGVDEQALRENIQLVMRSGYSAAVPEDRERLAALVRECQPDFIIFDTVAQISGLADLNSAGEVRKFFREHLHPLREVAPGVRFWLSHHTNKGIHATRRTTSDEGVISGSKDFQNAVDVVMLMQKVRVDENKNAVKNTHKITWLKGREVGDDDMQPILYEFQAEQQPDKWWSYRMQYLRTVDKREQGALQQAAAESKPTAKDLVLDVMRREPDEWWTYQEMAADTTLNTATVRRAMSELVKEGRVTKKGGGRGRGEPTRYRLTGVDEGGPAED